MIEPYWFGYWLGNGTSSSLCLTVSDEDSFLPYEMFYSCTSCCSNGDGNASKHYGFGYQGLMDKLRSLDVVENKHIPDSYFTASKAQRLQLMAGLIDSDGSLYKKTGQYRFTNCNERLVDDFVSLVYTFGWKCSVSWKDACESSSGIEGKQAVCQVGFTPTEEIPCRVPRKQSQKFVQRRRVGIAAVRELPEGEWEPGKCIQVASEDGLYLVGETLQPTHNSQLIAVRAVSWALGAFPGIQIALTGFSHTLLVDFMHTAQSIIDSDIYKKIFEGVVPIYGRFQSDSRHYQNGSGVLCKSSGSKLTGRRVDLLIIDDPHSGRDAAESPTQRRKIRDWYFADCVSRLSPNAKQFILATRWHPEDLIGHLTSDEYIEKLALEGRSDQQFHVVNFPALAEEDDPLGRGPGEALFPEERDVDFLKNIRASVPAYEWDSQYMGKPRPAGGGQADVSKLRYIDYDQVPDHVERARGWDLALTEKQTSDYSAGVMCGWDGETRELYIIDVFRKRLVWTKMKNRLISIALEDAEKENAHVMGFEAVAGFEIGLQELRRALLGRVRVVKRNPPRGGKLMRAQPWLNLIEAGSVYIVKAEWNRDFVHELTYFPDGDHDDQCDGVSISVETLTKRASVSLA